MSTTANSLRRGTAGARGTAGSAVLIRDRSATSSPVFVTYVIFVLVSFLNIGSRIPIIGLFRPSVLLVGLIAAMLAAQGQFKHRKDDSSSTKLLNAMIIYMVVSLPFVEWPGSVIRTNLQEFLKVAVFFYFTVQIVDTDARLKRFLAIVIGCQIFRVLEPLYMHLTSGYWGSRAHMGMGVFMNRLAGAPYDVVNPNGLAFVIITALPFMHYLMWGSRSKLLKLAYLALLPPMLYAFILTGSRSGLIGLMIIVGMLIWKSKHRAGLIVAIVVLGLAAVPMMSDEQRDRYLSLTSDDASQAATRDSRIRGILSDFGVGLRKPIFGHGLGTSLEANWNARGEHHYSHTLYAEVMIETGIVGLVIFCAFLASLVRNFGAAKDRFTRLKQSVGAEATDYYSRLVDAMQTWIAMCLVFSIAQYGLSEFHWYLFGGLSVATLRILDSWIDEVNAAVPSRVS